MRPALYGYQLSQPRCLVLMIWVCKVLALEARCRDKDGSRATGPAGVTPRQTRQGADTTHVEKRGRDCRLSGNHALEGKKGGVGWGWLQRSVARADFAAVCLLHANLGAGNRRELHDRSCCTRVRWEGGAGEKGR